ncbi:MAG: MmcQ/YjbR family DNA-binding protein [Planctomycetes bacterium]|nr:MmcQ/YjbR family DNA-binding protein [Planctomycetota bacterium]
MSRKSKGGSLLERVRAVALALPDTEESDRLGGSPHFYVRGKIFAGCGDEDGGWAVGMKVGLELQSILIQRDGIEVAKYVGRYGWISVAEEALQGDDELRELVELSYGLVSAKAPGRGRVAGKKGAKK